MSRYAMDKVIREVGRSEDGQTFERYMRDPAAYLAGRDLTDEERQALINVDIGTLYRLGAHPFILPGWAQRVLGADPRTFQQQYLDAIRPYGYPDFGT